MKKRILQIALWCIAGLIVMDGTAQTSGSSYVFDYRDTDGKIIVTLDVNGRAADFVVDLAGHTALLPAHLDALGIDTTRHGDPGYDHFLYKQVATRGIVEIGALTLGDAIYKSNVPAFVLDGDPAYLQSLDVAGIIGGSFFRDMVLTIDSRHRKITLSLPYRPTYMKLNYRADMRLLPGSGIACDVTIGGENRRQLYAIDEMSELQSYAFNYRIQAGYLLLDLVRYDVSTSADTLYLYPLQDGKNTPVTIFEETEDQELVGFYLRDDWVFYSVMADDSADRQTLYGYRISTKETKLLHDNWQSKNAISLKENTLYFSKEAEKLCKLDLHSGEITEFEPQLEQAGEYLNYAVAYDDQYFYLMTAEAVNSYGKPGLFIYSYEGELKQFIPYVDGQLLAYCMTGPDVSLFNAPQTGDYAPVCYLDKADIEKGNAEFHFFEG